MKSLFSFFKTKTFWIHLVLSMLSVAVVLWILFKFLAVYTNHGETVEVPDFSKKSILELNDFIKDKNIRFQIIDSLYDPKEQAGIVIRQDPEAKTLVKHNRTIYLYVTSMLPPQISMPKLVDASVRQATLMIESYGLKVGKKIEKEGDCNGCVLKQFYEGKEIEPGTPIKKGSVIDLQIGVKKLGGNTLSSDSLSGSGNNFLDGDDDNNSIHE